MFRPNPSKSLCEFLTNGLIGFIQVIVHTKPVVCAASVFGLFLFSLPVQGQEERKTPWSLEQVQKMTGLSFLREAILDSIDKKLARFEGDSLKRTAKLSGFAHPIREQLETLTGSNGPQALLRSLPALYAQKNANLPSLKRATSFHFSDFAANSLFQSNQVISTASFGAEATIGGVPFSAQLTAAYPATIEQIVTPHFKLSFEREAFLQSLRKQITQHYDPEKVLLKDLDFQGIIKSYAQRKMVSVKNTYQQFLSSNPLVQDNFSALSVDEFLLLTKEQLQARIKDKYWDSLTALRAVVTRKIAAYGKDTAALQMQLDNIDSSLAVFQRLTEHITRVKDEFEATGANYNQLVQYQRTTNQQAQSLISSERFVQESAQNLFQSKGFAGLFVYLRHLTAGQFSSPWDSHSISGIMTSGIAGDFFKKNKFFGAQFSRIENLGWLKDGAYSGNFFELRALLQAVRIGSGQLEKEHVHLSLLNSTSLNSYTNALATLPRNTFTGAFSQRFAVSAIGTFDVEVAKSVTQYRNTLADGGDQYAPRAALRYFGEDFWQTLSASVNYEGNLSSLNMRPKAFLRVAGMGYNNNASTLQTRGSLSYGLGLQKSFLKGRFSVQDQFSTKRTNTSTLFNNRYVQLQNSFSAKYKLNRKVKLGAGWNLSQLWRKEGHKNSRLYFSNRITGDLTVINRIKALPVFHYTSMGYQRLSIPGTAESGGGKLFWISSSTSLSFPKGTLSATLQYQAQRDRRALFGDFLSTETAWAYKIGEGIQLSSGVTYLAQQGAARQAGIRQTVNAQVTERVDFRFSADIRRNVGPYPENIFYPTSRGDVQFLYRFN